MLFLIIPTFSFDSSKKNINFEAAKVITSFKKLKRIDNTKNRRSKNGRIQKEKRARYE